MKKLKYLLLASFLMFALQIPGMVVWAMDGLTLAQKVFDRDDGDDAYAKMQMVLVDKRGNTRSRTLISAIKDFGDLSKTFTRFTAPPSIDGTGFLTWENEDRDDDQFLYLPALRRVRRIVSSQKDNRFVNTDYTYEDMETRRPEKDRHTIIGNETLGNHDCWILESIPKDPDQSQYSKRVTWIVKEIFIPIKTEYYDKKGRLQKVFKARALHKIQGIWTITESEMHDMEREHRTLMKTVGIKYNSGIPDYVFTRRYLQTTK